MVAAGGCFVAVAARFVAVFVGCAFVAVRDDAFVLVVRARVFEGVARARGAVRRSTSPPAARSRSIASMCSRCSAGMAAADSRIMRSKALSDLMRSRITGSASMRMCKSVIVESWPMPGIARVLSMMCPACAVSRMGARVVSRIVL